MRELVARREFFRLGKMLGGMLMVSPVLSMNLSKLARKPRPSSPPLQWCLRVFSFGPSYALFTDGSASASPPFAAGWGLHILDPTGCVAHED